MPKTYDFKDLDKLLLDFVDFLFETSARNEIKRSGDPGALVRRLPIVPGINYVSKARNNFYPWQMSDFGKCCSVTRDIPEWKGGKHDKV